MPPMQNVLVAIDRTPFARRVLDHATRYAAAMGASLTVLHVAEIPPVLPVPEGGALGHDPWFDARALRDGARQEVLARVEESSAHSLAPEVILRSGLAGEEITLEAKERNCDLIVIGSHGRSGLSRLLLGSVAEKVAIDAPCAVLTVRGEDTSTEAKPAAEPPRRILVPTDLSPRSMEAVPAAIELAEAFGAELALLTVLEDPLEHPEIHWVERAGISPEEVKAHCASETRKALSAALAAGGVREPFPRLEIAYGPPARTVVERAKAEGYDLIVTAGRGHGRWLGTVLGSVARAIVRGAPCPVLTLRGVPSTAPGPDGP